MIAHNRTQEVRTVCKLIRAYCAIHTVDASSGELFFVILTFWSFRCHWVRFNIDLFTHTVIWYCDGHIADVFAVKLCDKSLAMYIADIDPLLNVYGMEQYIVCNKVTCNIATTGTYISVDIISIYLSLSLYIYICAGVLLCCQWSCDYMMTSSNGNIFRVTCHLCGEFTGPRWNPRTKASDAEVWCFLWSTSE